MQLIYQRESITVDELKDATELGVTTLREHIEDLEEHDLVEHNKQSVGRGRPRHHYFLTDRAKTLFASPDDSLSQILFKALRKSLPEEQIQIILRNTLIEFLNSTNQQIKQILDDDDELKDTVREKSA